MTIDSTPTARSLPRTADNTLLAGAGDGTRVELRGIVKDYGTTRVLHGVDLDVAPGEFISLLGPSGCGKTTALRVISGLEPATSGSVAFGGSDITRIPTNKRDIGMVFQAYSLFPHLRVRENVAFGLRRRKVDAATARRRSGEALDLVGLGHLADRYPHELSGGQQQRVALARALVTEPRVLLLDEPLSALDAKVRVQLRDEIRRIQLRLGTTTVFVTHDQEEALAVSDRIAVMDAGRIEQVGTPEDLYRHPATPRVAAFVGLSSAVQGIVSAGGVSVWGTVVPVQGDAPDGPVDALVRPEHVHLVGVGQGVGAVVEESTFLGSIRRTLVRTDDGTLVRLQHPADERLEYGERVRIALSPVPLSVRGR
ncbi:ABC transporter ATP-binding protein [Microbacterium sp. EYE_5]|uniref:ABC transporter ATP-binding protein n=1 Tax=unclassified Microbacterium TaxID=2609290 RepID=UPI0020043710|nr:MULTISPECIES: ABC transporter ATP-binding protein [unclassified Microbacterium]MCK6080136.1 ABC transporter ATP-binding protein [Microbacterium sp. EYE_382]MCK6085407.1 ABC transporter ATP-binding protein [Microbacterium sp. EYE_384]MCK6122368.1 ABC transporter ATP-binding protein [Microbacterium sp. EYE_80]MCK6126170.1 ABC transporter ATP-binding protein [Microbacterium sp. EYE_79]MCK6141091.1 ABC transporter ATP-binding protein [Microbacterium sp. EYE_39]